MVVLGFDAGEVLDFLRGLPEKKVIGEVTLAHGSPRNPVWEYILDLRIARLNFEFFETPYCFIGHTHLPLIYQLDGEPEGIELILSQPGDRYYLSGRALINPGSVGQPRDHNPLASYALFNPIDKTWENHRVPYDIKSVQKRIMQTGLPPRHALRLAEGW